MTARPYRRRSDVAMEEARALEKVRRGEPAADANYGEYRERTRAKVREAQKPRVSLSNLDRARRGQSNPGQ